MAKIEFPFKNNNNQRYTKQLFLETWRELPIEDRVVEPAFTLYLDKEGLINLGKEYVNDADPSGYTTSLRIFGEYAYWTYLLKRPWFREAVDSWNQELDAKLYAEGIEKIRQIAMSEDKGALVAAKFLVQQGYKNKEDTKGRGRPSKAEVDNALKRAVESAKDIEEDAKRIGLV